MMLLLQQLEERKKTTQIIPARFFVCFFVCFCIGCEGPHFNAVDVAAANTKKNGVWEGDREEQKRKT